MFLHFSSSVGPFVCLLSLFLALLFFVFTVSDFCLKKINAYGNSFESNSYMVLHFFLHFSQVSKFNLLLLLVWLLISLLTPCDTSENKINNFQYCTLLSFLNYLIRCFQCQSVMLWLRKEKFSSLLKSSIQ